MTERGTIFFLAACFIGAVLLAIAAGKAIGEALVMRDAAPRIEKVAPVPLERPAARFGEREASTFALRASEDFT